MNTSFNSSVPKANWSLAAQPKQPVSNLANLDLIHVPNANYDANKPTLKAKEQFVLLPETEEDRPDVAPTAEMSAGETYIAQALLYFEQNQLQESIAASKEALRVCPDLGVAYKIWGNCLQRLGKSAEAIGIYAKALENKADMAEIYCNVGSIYAKQKKWQSAIEHYQKSIIINPRIATPYRNLARVWDELREYSKSADCFFKAINLQPSLLSSQNHFHLANNLLSEGNRVQAISCYQSCIELEPKFLNAYARLADALEEDGQLEKSLFYYKKLAQLQTETELPPSAQSKSSQQISSLLKPGNKKASAAPQQLRRLPAIGAKMPQLQPAKVIEPDSKAAPSSPSAAQTQFELGNRYIETRQWRNAIKCYLKAVKLDPRKAIYQVHLGRAWERANNHQQANLAFYRGFSLKPDKVSAKNHYLLGEKLLKQNETNKAIDCYRRVLQTKPKFIQAYWRLGEIAVAGGDIKAALAYYRRALKIEPRWVQNYLLMGKTLATAGNWQAALTCYQKAASIKPQNADIQCQLSHALVNLQRYNEAAEILRQSVAQNPQYWRGYHQLGDILSQQEEWSEAIEAYNRAIALNPQDYSLSYHYLGQAYLELQQWQPALNSFKQAISLNSNSPWSYYGLGSALSELGQWQAAITALERSLQLNPDFDWAHHKLGNAKAAVEDWQGAVNAYQRASEITPDLPHAQSKLKNARAKSSMDLTSDVIEGQKSSTSPLQELITKLPSEPEFYLSLSSENE